MKIFKQILNYLKNRKRLEEVMRKHRNMRYSENHNVLARERSFYRELYELLIDIS
jgi:hypothetical protein